MKTVRFYTWLDIGTVVLCALAGSLMVFTKWMTGEWVFAVIFSAIVPPWLWLVIDSTRRRAKRRAKMKNSTPPA